MSDITIILAPLQGFTDATFRNVFCRHFDGLDEALAPFISTMGEQRLKPSRIRDVAPEINRRLPVVPQIMGNVPRDFVFLAGHLSELGHSRLNWNLGCPHSKIAKKQRGSGLLCHPERIDTFLSEVMPQLSAGLSVKIRLGRHTAGEIDHLLPMFDRHPLEEIILHPRTGVQMYTGRADLDAFEHALSGSSHSFTYNGDIVDLETFTRISDRFPQISRFMIGRGIIANPFLAEDIKGIPRTGKKTDRMKDFHDDLLSSYQAIFSGPGHLTNRMKGFWTYWGPSFHDSTKALKKILKSRSFPAYLNRVDEFFSSRPGFRFKDGMS